MHIRFKINKNIELRFISSFSRVNDLYCTMSLLILTGHLASSIARAFTVLFVLCSYMFILCIPEYVNMRACVYIYLILREYFVLLLSFHAWSRLNRHVYSTVRKYQLCRRTMSPPKGGR